MNGPVPALVMDRRSQTSHNNKEDDLVLILLLRQAYGDIADMICAIAFV